MYIHSEMLLPDYIALAMLITTFLFIIFILLYGIFDVLGLRLRIRVEGVKLTMKLKVPCPKSI